MTGQQFDNYMNLICQGDKNALAEIYQEYLPYVFSIISGIVQNRASAEDVTSDFFVKLWSNSEKYVPGSGHKAFIATMARNMAIDYLRKYKREVLTDSFEGDYDEDDRPKSAVTLSDDGGASINTGEPTSLVENEVIGDISLKEALETLKPREREVINYKIIGDMTFKEIAQIMDAPMGTVTWLYRQAIDKLRRYGYE